MQARSDATFPLPGPDPSAGAETASASRAPGRVPPPVLTAAVAAATRLATDEPQPPIALTPLSEEEIASLLAPATLPTRVTAPAGARNANPDSDVALMRAYASGHAEAFTRLYDRHERSTWRFIRHRLGPHHESAADDVMQETWISVSRAAPRYVPTAKFTTWLFAIARSRAIDHLRAQAHASLSLDAALDDAAEDDAAWADNLPADRTNEPVVRVESRQQAEAFLAALAQLPPLQREAFVLHVEGDMTVEEIAQITGVGAETAKTRLRYARARLRSLLAEWSTP